MKIAALTTEPVHTPRNPRSWDAPAGREAPRTTHRPGGKLTDDAPALKGRGVGGVGAGTQIQLTRGASALGVLFITLHSERVLLDTHFMWSDHECSTLGDQVVG